MRWLTRLLLLRVLPRRLVPLLAVWELYRLLRRSKADDDATTSGPRPTRGPAARRPQVR